MTMPHLISSRCTRGGSGEINGTTCKIFVGLGMVEQRTFHGRRHEQQRKLAILPTFAAAPTDATGTLTENGAAPHRCGV
jgi:hypothetical protein